MAGEEELSDIASNLIDRATIHQIKQETKKDEVNNMEENAIIYLRVATTEQRPGSLSLEDQEAHCRSYCRQMHLKVVGVFTDVGWSGNRGSRPEFQRMLGFCTSPFNNVRYVVVRDLSRIARDLRLLVETVSALGLSGVQLRSTSESNIDEAAPGRLEANIFGALDQFFSDSLSEKQRVGKRDAVAAGRVPWRAPLGYINIRSTSGSNITPDPERAPLIFEGFRLIAIEGMAKGAALKAITGMGLRTLKGTPVNERTFDRILTNPIYAGWITLPSAPEFRPVRGLHKAIVPQDLFDRVRAFLARKKRKQNPSPGESRPKGT